MALPTPPMQGLASMQSANMQQAPIQAAARAPGVATQMQPAKSPLDQAVPPQMQGLQAQLGQMAQAQQMMQPQMMQTILGMMGPGAGAPQAPGLGQLMQPAMPVAPPVAAGTASPSMAGTAPASTIATAAQLR